MKFEKYIVAILFLTIFTQSINGQSSESKIFIKAYGGYGFLTPGAYQIQQTVNSGPPDNITTGSLTSGLGKGFHYGGGLGYIVNEFLNLGIDVDYLAGKKLTLSSFYKNTAPQGTFFRSANQEITNSILSVVPNITFKALSQPSYYIYTRIGLLIAVDTKLQSVASDTTSIQSGISSNGSSITNDVYEFKTSLGVQASFGVQFKLTKSLRGFVEALGYFLPATPSKETSTYTSTRSSSMQSVNPMYDKQISTTIYQKSGYDDYQYTKTGSGTSPSDPTIETTNTNALVEVKNFNYVGLNIGIAYRF